MTDKEQRAFDKVKEAFPDKYIEYGIKVGADYVFSLIPNDAPPIGAITGDLIRVDGLFMKMHPYNAADDIKRFNKAIGDPFYVGEETEKRRKEMLSKNDLAEWELPPYVHGENT